MKETINLFWFRRDLRLDDNVGLFNALKSEFNVLPIFIFDSDILKKLPESDPRVSFIFKTLQDLKHTLETKYSSTLGIYFGKPSEVYKQLTATYTINTVYTNHDYEPYAIKRDQDIKTFLNTKSIQFKTFKDQVVFEKNEITKKDGKPYVVYTPFMKKWKSNFTFNLLEEYNTEPFFDQFVKISLDQNVTLENIGFKLSHQTIEPYKVSPSLINNYEETRNFPAKDSTSKLGPHLRFGTVSTRKIMKKAIAEKNEIFWQELIWREFFMQILWHFPSTQKNSFKSKYDRIVWRNNESEFKAWCDGNTGYPLVDAGMRQLNATGFMHNRVRMLVGSFLCKHLLIDWRWGEAYFAQKLHDYEMSSNVGNWQWVSGSGVDASPYFRIFNPTTQIDKFDKQHEYIQKWVPDYQELTYPKPIVDHKIARERCLKVYKEAVS